MFSQHAQMMELEHAAQDYKFSSAEEEEEEEDYNENKKEYRSRSSSKWCSAINCTNSKVRCPDLAFFSFPLDAER